MAKLTSKDVSATKQRNGSWEIAAMVDNHRASKVYYGFSKREAVSSFVAEANAGVFSPHPFGHPSILRGGARGPEGSPPRIPMLRHSKAYDVKHGLAADDASYRFTLYIDTDNDAFVGSARNFEVARILHTVAKQLSEGEDDFSMFRTLRDANGNDVGRAKFERQS